MGTNVGSLAMPQPLITKLMDNSQQSNNQDQCGAWNDFDNSYSYQSEDLPGAVEGATVWYSFEGTGEEVGISFCSMLTEMEVQPVLYVNDGTFCNDNGGAFFLEDPDPDYFWWQCGNWLTPAGRQGSDCCSMLLADTVEYHMYFLGVQGKNGDEGTFGLAMYSHFNGCENSLVLPVDGTATVLTDKANATNPLRQTMSSQGKVVWLTFTGTGTSVTVSVKGRTGDSRGVRLRTYRGSCDDGKMALLSEDYSGGGSSSYHSNHNSDTMTGVTTIDSEEGMSYYITVSACSSEDDYYYNDDSPVFDSSYGTNTCGDDIDIEIALYKATEGCLEATELAADGMFLPGTLDQSNFGTGICEREPFLGPIAWYSFQGDGDDLTVILCPDDSEEESTMAPGYSRTERIPHLLGYMGSCANNTLSCLSNSYYSYSGSDSMVSMYHESSLVNDCRITHFRNPAEGETYYVSASLLRDSYSTSAGVGGAFSIGIMKKGGIVCADAPLLSPAESATTVEGTFQYTDSEPSFVWGCSSSYMHGGQIKWYTFVGSGKYVQFGGDETVSVEIFKGSCATDVDVLECAPGGFTGGYGNQGSTWQPEKDQVYSVAVIDLEGDTEDQSSRDFEIRFLEADTAICEQEMSTRPTLEIGVPTRIQSVEGTISYAECFNRVGLVATYTFVGGGDRMNIEMNPGNTGWDFTGNEGYVQVKAGGPCSGSCIDYVSLNNDYTQNDYFYTTSGQMYTLLVLDTSSNYLDNVNSTTLNVDFTLTISIPTPEPTPPPTSRPTPRPTSQPTPTATAVSRTQPTKTIQPAPTRGPVVSPADVEAAPESEAGTALDMPNGVAAESALVTRESAASNQTANLEQASSSSKRSINSFGLCAAWVVTYYLPGGLL